MEVGYILCSSGIFILTSFFVFSAGSVSRGATLETSQAGEPPRTRRSESLARIIAKSISELMLRRMHHTLALVYTAFVFASSSILFQSIP